MRDFMLCFPLRTVESGAGSHSAIISTLDSATASVREATLDNKHRSVPLTAAHLGSPYVVVEYPAESWSATDRSLWSGPVIWI